MCFPHAAIDSSVRVSDSESVCLSASSPVMESIFSCELECTSVFLNYYYFFEPRNKQCAQSSRHRYEDKIYMVNY